MDRYRLKQDGIVVAVVEGPSQSARQEIMHYAMMYAQDGPVVIERIRNGRWERYK